MTYQDNLIAIADTILKEGYIDAMRNAIFTESSFIAKKIWANNKGYDGSDVITCPVPVGLVGGAGFGDLTGENAAKAANRIRKRYTETPVEFQVAIELYDRLARSDMSKAQMINYVQDELEGATETAQWQFGRALFGNGTGVLATITAQAAGAESVKVDDGRNLIAGILVDIYPKGAAVGSEPTYKKARITDVADNADGSATVYFEGQSITVAAEAFITLQNSYGNEITGIDALFDESVTEIAGIEKAKNLWVKPKVIDVGHDLTFNKMRDAMRSARRKNGKIDVIAAGAGAYDAFAEEIQASGTQIISKNEGEGGFKSLSFIHGTDRVDVYEEQFVKKGEMIGLSTKDIIPYMSKLDYAKAAPEAVAFQLIPGTSKYGALMTSYGNYIYRNPGGMFKLTNCDIAA
ncbi:MAG: phage major capsid protein [Clostridia bacterium]|nr:phage major capsid protein [Clostridia bacterium]